MSRTNRFRLTAYSALRMPFRSQFDHSHAFYGTFEAPNELRFNLLDTYIFRMIRDLHGEG